MNGTNVQTFIFEFYQKSERNDYLGVKVPKHSNEPELDLLAF